MPDWFDPAEPCGDTAPPDHLTERARARAAEARDAQAVREQRVFWREISLLVLTPLVLIGGILIVARLLPRSARAQAVALEQNQERLDSLAATLGGEGWRRIGWAECAITHCERWGAPGRPRHPYATAADFNHDGRLDIALALTDDSTDYIVWFPASDSGYDSPELLGTFTARPARRYGLAVSDSGVLELRTRPGAPWLTYRWDSTDNGMLLQEDLDR